MGVQTLGKYQNVLTWFVCWGWACWLLKRSLNRSNESAEHLRRQIWIHRSKPNEYRRNRGWSGSDELRYFSSCFRWVNTRRISLSRSIFSYSSMRDWCSFIVSRCFSTVFIIALFKYNRFCMKSWHIVDELTSESSWSTSRVSLKSPVVRPFTDSDLALADLPRFEFDLRLVEPDFFVNVFSLSDLVSALMKEIINFIYDITRKRNFN